MPDMNSIVYREDVIPGDREEVGRLIRATGFFSEEEVAIAEELVEERLAKGEASGHFFLFAEEGGVSWVTPVLARFPVRSTALTSTGSPWRRKRRDGLSGKNSWPNRNGL